MPNQWLLGYSLPGSCVPFCSDANNRPKNQSINYPVNYIYFVITMCNPEHYFSLCTITFTELMHDALEYNVAYSIKDDYGVQVMCSLIHFSSYF